jgi:hypothetical protein
MSIIFAILIGLVSICDKGLSVLLGGLSGYILGRYNNPASAGAPVGAADPEGAPA